jgi:hypothetical protein
LYPEADLGKCRELVKKTERGVAVIPGFPKGDDSVNEDRQKLRFQEYRDISLAIDFASESTSSQEDDDDDHHDSSLDDEAETELYPEVGVVIPQRNNSVLFRYTDHIDSL